MDSAICWTVWVQWVESAATSISPPQYGQPRKTDTAHLLLISIIIRISRGYHSPSEIFDRAIAVTAAGVNTQSIPRRPPCPESFLGNVGAQEVSGAVLLPVSCGLGEHRPRGGAWHVPELELYERMWHHPGCCWTPPPNEQGCRHCNTACWLCADHSEVTSCLLTGVGDVLTQPSNKAFLRQGLPGHAIPKANNTVVQCIWWGAVCST